MGRVFVNICAMLFLLNATLTSETGGTTSISFEQLLREMVDLKTLAVCPDPPYIAARASSCDTTVPADSVPAGFGNNDRGYFRDVLPEGHLMLDARGPGVITHIWSANPCDSLVFYFDNQVTPSWTVSMACFLDGTGLIKEPFSQISAQGQNCYFPIPYQTRCRIFYKGNRPNYIYYHIDYRTYTNAALLQTFDTAMVIKYKSLIDSIKTVLTDSLESTISNLDDKMFSGTVPPEQVVTAAKLDGPAAISEIVVTLADKTSAAFLRSCLLEITFDNTAYPQVRVPIGEFFCSIPGQKPYWTLPLSRFSSGKMVSQWFMPFREHAVIRFVNIGEDSGSIFMQIKTQPIQFSDKTMYFFARWRQDTSVITRKNLYGSFYMAEPVHDHSMLHINGNGVHVGTILHIWNREEEWWGEGDDKITVDNLPEPGFKGTGTEDYFGYAWSSTNTFSHAYHAQPYTDGFTGHTINARFHISDPQPFTKSFKFDMEIKTVNKPTMLDFGRVILFYARGEATTDHDTITNEDIFLRAGQPLYVYGSINGVDKSERNVIRYGLKRNLVITGYPNEKVSINIVMLTGRIVARNHQMRATAIGAASLPSGVYIANVSLNGKQNSFRFIVNR